MLNLSELSEDEFMRRWPDREGKRGRPRAVKYAYIERIVRMRLMSERGGDYPEWFPIYKGVGYNNAYQVCARMRSMPIWFLPPGTWSFELATNEEEEVEEIVDRAGVVYFIVARWLPPVDENLLYRALPWTKELVDAVDLTEEEVHNDEHVLERTTYGPAGKPGSKPDPRLA